MSPRAHEEEFVDEPTGPLARVADFPSWPLPWLLAQRNTLEVMTALRRATEQGVAATVRLAEAAKQSAETAKSHLDRAGHALRRAKWFFWLAVAALALNGGLSLARWRGWSP